MSSIRKSFGDAASARSGWCREGLPDPARLAADGIRTRESLDWLAARHPRPPALEYHPPDSALRQAATDAAAKAHRDLINRLRAEFQGRGEKSQRDFGTAHDYRGHDRGR